jgi:PAS domain S-box-containing protein
MLKLIDDLVNYTVCDPVTASPFPPELTNARSLITMILYYQTFWAHELEEENWLGHFRYCDLASNVNSLIDAIDVMLTSFYEGSMAHSANMQQRTRVFEVFFSAALFLLALVPQVVLVAAFMRELAQLRAVLLGIAQAEKVNAMLPISNLGKPDSNNSTELPTQCMREIPLLVGQIVLAALLALSECLAMRTMQKSSTQMMQINSWTYLAMMRMATSITTAYKITGTVVFNDSIRQNFITRSKMILDAHKHLGRMDSYNHLLLMGGDDVPHSYGFDDKLDHLYTMETCKSAENITDMHDLYWCFSAHHILALYKDMAQEILADPDAFVGTLDAEIPLHFLHMAVSHIWDFQARVIARLEEAAAEESAKMKLKMVSFMVAGVAACLLWLTLSFFMRRQMWHNYCVGLSLVKRVAPAAIVQSRPFLEFITMKSSEVNQRSMGNAESVIHNSLSGIMFTNHNGTIEIVNQTVIASLGYTPEQILGKPVDVFFDDASSATLRKQLDLMHSGEASPTFEMYLNIIDEQRCQIACDVVVLLMQNEHTTSFVVIFQDESEVNAKQREAEVAKGQAETLLQ